MIDKESFQMYYLSYEYNDMTGKRKNVSEFIETTDEAIHNIFKSLINLPDFNLIEMSSENENE